MIHELTAEQAALLPAIRERWLRVCLSTEPADRLAAEEALAGAYASAGLRPPSSVVWMESPLAGKIQAGAMAVERERRRRTVAVDDGIWSVLLKLFAKAGGKPLPGVDCGDSVLAQLREATSGGIQQRLNAEVSADVWWDVRDALSDRRVSAEVNRQVFARFTEAVNEALGVAEDDAAPRAVDDVFTVYGGHGQHDAWWAAMCEFFEQVGVLETTETLEPLRRLARSCGQWWAFENAAVLTERPRVLLLDHSERPHSESGPAVEYPDGFSVYAWHGTEMPAGTVIDVDSLTVERIEAEPNGRLRPVLVDLFGRERYLSEKRATLTHQEGRWGSIYHISTDRECSALHEVGSCRFIPVPAFVQTARQAWAWQTRQELSAFDNSPNAPFGVG
ncbi:MAG: hypothetical protein M3Z27_03435 [Actinomycetota bacterium]|nr:hypothetical protein [Actinomycetota bacterium]